MCIYGRQGSHEKLLACSNPSSTNRVCLEKQKAMRLLFIGLILATAMGCKPEGQNVTHETLTGTWVEAYARQDTIIFNPVFQGTVLENTLIVKRGKEINAGGQLVPKLGFGIYKYKIDNKRIYLQGGTSSLATYHANFGIEQRGDELLIDNFYEVNSTQPATDIRRLVRVL